MLSFRDRAVLVFRDKSVHSKGDTFQGFGKTQNMAARSLWGNNVIFFLFVDQFFFTPEPEVVLIVVLSFSLFCVWCDSVSEIPLIR